MDKVSGGVHPDKGGSPSGRAINQFFFWQQPCPGDRDLCVERREFKRQTIDNNEGFVLQIPFLKGAFGMLYYVIDKQNGHMMGIIDDNYKA